MSDIDSIVAEGLKDPDFRAGFEDQMQLCDLMDALMTARRDAGLTQVQVGERMHVAGSTVSRIERSAAPTINELASYARAVGKRLTVRLEAAS